MTDYRPSKFHYFLCLAIAIGCVSQEQTEIKNLKGFEVPTDSIDAFLKSRMDTLNIPGLSIAVLNDSKVVYRDIDAASKHFASDIINYGNGAIPPQKGIEAVTASLRMFTGAFPIDKIDKLVAVADGDWVMLWGKWSGTWRGDFMGQPATGKSFTKPEVEIFRFNEEGEIIEHHSVQAFGEVARQIGMKLPGQ